MAGAGDPDGLARALALLPDGAMSAASMDNGADVPAAVTTAAATLVDAALDRPQPALRAELAD
ncbi:MAG TPA: hypothetical protein VGR21_11250 [Cryptosporangiaceae bacterium]|nr:hypothetical protein [Cryptosporangiaceae bacterium]